VNAASSCPCCNVWMMSEITEVGGGSRGLMQTNLHENKTLEIDPSWRRRESHFDFSIERRRDRSEKLDKLGVSFLRARE
jgi:hypothetical protein